MTNLEYMPNPENIYVKYRPGMTFKDFEDPCLKSAAEDGVAMGAPKWADPIHFNLWVTARRNATTGALGVITGLIAIMQGLIMLIMLLMSGWGALFLIIGFIRYKLVRRS
jgi:hypothetical protein